MEDRYLLYIKECIRYKEMVYIKNTLAPWTIGSTGNRKHRKGKKISIWSHDRDGFILLLFYWNWWKFDCWLVIIPEWTFNVHIMIQLEHGDVEMIWSSFQDRGRVLQILRVFLSVHLNLCCSVEILLLPMSPDILSEELNHLPPVDMICGIILKVLF